MLLITRNIGGASLEAVEKPMFLHDSDMLIRIPILSIADANTDKLLMSVMVGYKIVQNKESDIGEEAGVDELTDIKCCRQ